MGRVLSGCIAVGFSNPAQTFQHRQLPASSELLPLLAIVSKTERLRKVVLEAKLDTKIIDTKAISEIVASSPLKLAADRHVLNRAIKKIYDPILSPVKGVVGLSIRIFKVEHRITY